VLRQGYFWDLSFYQANATIKRPALHFIFPVFFKNFSTSTLIAFVKRLVNILFTGPVSKG
jgi:hypothetical protein